MKRKVIDFDILNQAFVYYVSNIGHQNHWKKADLKRSKYVEYFSLPWTNDTPKETKFKKGKFLIWGHQIRKDTVTYKMSKH